MYQMYSFHGARILFSIILLLGVFAAPLTVVYEYTAQPTSNRPYFLIYFRNVVAAQFAAWVADGTVTSYELRIATQANAVSWDAQAILYFADAATWSSKWRPIEASYPGGLNTDALTMATVSASYIGRNWSASAPTRGVNPATSSSTLVQLYSLADTVNASGFASFATGYAVPLYSSLLSGGMLSRYEVIENSLAPFGVAAPLWGAIALLEFVSADALTSSSQLLDDAAATLRGSDPVWAAWEVTAPSVWTPFGSVVSEWVSTRPPATYAPTELSIYDPASAPALVMTFCVLMTPLAAVLVYYLMRQVVKIIQQKRRQHAALVAATESSTDDEAMESMMNTVRFSMEEAQPKQLARRLSALYVGNSDVNPTNPVSNIVNSSSSSAMVGGANSNNNNGTDVATAVVVPSVNKWKNGV